MNWAFDDVVRFLRDHRFTLNYTSGSHYYYVGHFGGQFRQVHVQFHGAKALKPRTMNGVIKQSGIPKREWLGW